VAEGPDFAFRGAGLALHHRHITLLVSHSFLLGHRPLPEEAGAPLLTEGHGPGRRPPPSAWRIFFTTADWCSSEQPFFRNSFFLNPGGRLAIHLRATVGSDPARSLPLTSHRRRSQPGAGGSPLTGRRRPAALGGSLRPRQFPCCPPFESLFFPFARGLLSGTVRPGLVQVAGGSTTRLFGIRLNPGS